MESALSPLLTCNAPSPLTNSVLYGNGDVAKVTNGGGTVSATNCDIQAALAARRNHRRWREHQRRSSSLRRSRAMAARRRPWRLGANSPCYGAGPPRQGAATTDQREVTRPNPPSMGAYDAFITPIPVINPGGGMYSAPQHVSITDYVTAASIYYTTDGSARRQLRRSMLIPLR